MSDERTGLFAQLLEAERRFYERLPGEEIYSKLFVRTLLWFALFSALYTIATSL
ncbi:hypothetical protein [Natrinema salaciae]|uniref:Uncharacterized protein n=1 Tax=Natrinema salaciae TaxID=1186196 RepID=A0A1H9NUM0_9EURY|nr:hypothetical protein [Natrinema salaciae]SER39033.1 hypothetical protein SAMN04489841_3724 [Natrinema salaciae]